MKKTWIYRNSLTIVLLLLFAASLTGQIFTGWHEHNGDLEQLGGAAIGLGEYLKSGHFIETTFENWESEFLQMGMYVLLTISLRQQGSSESKQIDGEEEVDREPDPERPGAPLPVKKGGVVLKIYKNSLSIAFGILFAASFVLHAHGSHVDYNEEQILTGKSPVSFSAYLGGSRFWFESFQNWQSEFLAVISIVVLSIFLRQQGSPESKPVDASMTETGSG